MKVINCLISGAQDIFKQHWIIYTLESYMYEHFAKNSLSDRIMQMQISRIAYIEKVSIFKTLFTFKETV